MAAAFVLSTGTICVTYENFNYSSNDCLHFGEECIIIVINNAFSRSLYTQTMDHWRNSMGNRYQKYTRPGGAGFGKGGTGTRPAGILARLGIGQKEKQSAFRLPDEDTGYQAQGGFEDEDDGRILRHRPGSNFSPVTGTYVMRQSEPSRRRKVWPWIVLAFGAILLLNFAFNRNDSVNMSPTGSPPPVAQAMADAGGPADNAPAADTPAPTAEPTPALTRKPTAPPTPTPEATSSVLKYGSKSDAVKDLQGQLIALGYIALGADDGAFGDVTQAAVLSFQKVNGLDADGIAGEKTLALISSGTAKEDPDVFVWVTSKGKEYHSDKDCDGMKDAKQIKKSLAEKRKLKPCDKCN